MNEVKTIQLEWQYSPKNYLEEPISISFEGGSIKISEGMALAEIEPSIFHEDEAIRQNLTALIESRLQAVQIMTHADFDLGKPSRTDIRADGKKVHFLEALSKMVLGSFGSMDSEKTKSDRLDKQRWFASVIDKHRATDVTLDQLLKSYQMSVKDPDNEFVHLYEIRDSLSDKFGSKKNALVNLSITNKQWDEIGELANSLPIKQGRHRGKSAGSLRDAYSSELKCGRKSVANLIEKYLEYLESE